MPSSSKGGAFEREISRKLSLWWSGGQHDDWFWRTGGSGGRATNRAKSGKATINGYGDIMAQCGEAQKLLDIVTFELKRGYNVATVSDLLDIESGGTMAKFIEQASKAASLAGTPHWAIIHKRDRRTPLMITSCWGFVDKCNNWIEYAERNPPLTSKWTAVYVLTLDSCLSESSKENLHNHWY